METENKKEALTGYANGLRGRVRQACRDDLRREQLKAALRKKVSVYSRLIYILSDFREYELSEGVEKNINALIEAANFSISKCLIALKKEDAEQVAALEERKEKESAPNGSGDGITKQRV